MRPALPTEPALAQPPAALANRLTLPDFCAGQAALAVAVLVELTAIVLTLAGTVVSWAQLARTSLFLLWIGLGCAAVLCLLRLRLAQLPLSIACALALGAISAVVALVSSVALRLATLLPWDASPDGPLAAQQAFEFLVRNLAIGLIVGALALRYFYVSSEWRRNVVMQARARVHALQARIRPHFLFNSMNTIAALTRSNPAQAEEAVQDLADLFRANLNESRGQITLREELEVARLYQRMESLRLGARLQVIWDVVDLPMNALVPSLLVQPLLENAIYHGIEPCVGGGTVTVSGTLDGQQIGLTVRNPLPTASDSAREGNRIALANIRERMDLMYGGRASIESGRVGDEYIVRLRFPYVDALAAEPS